MKQSMYYYLIISFSLTFLQMSWMDESIVNSAKTILARQMTEDTEDDAGKKEKIKHLEDLVSSQSAAITRLEDKLDKLLRLRV